MSLPTLVVENCEPPSKWLWLEYRHTAQIWEKTLFTNVRNKKMRKKLNSISKAYMGNVWKYVRGKCIVLDPYADKELSTKDFSGASYIIIGGILGDKKFTGKTKKLITDKFMTDKLRKNHIKIRDRNLGEKQLSIDSSAFVTYLLYSGMSLKEIELTSEVVIKYNGRESILPYAYPLIDGHLIITPGLVDYLRRH